MNRYEFGKAFSTSTERAGLMVLQLDHRRLIGGLALDGASADAEIAEPSATERARQGRDVRGICLSFAGPSGVLVHASNSDPEIFLVDQV